MVSPLVLVVVKAMEPVAAGILRAHTEAVTDKVHIVHMVKVHTVVIAITVAQTLDGRMEKERTAVDIVKVRISPVLLDTP